MLNNHVLTAALTLLLTAGCDDDANQNRTVDPGDAARQEDRDISTNRPTDPALRTDDKVAGTRDDGVEKVNLPGDAGTIVRDYTVDKNILVSTWQKEVDTIEAEFKQLSAEGNAQAEKIDDKTDRALKDALGELADVEAKIAKTADQTADQMDTHGKDIDKKIADLKEDLREVKAYIAEKQEDAAQAVRDNEPD